MGIPVLVISRMDNQEFTAIEDEEKDLKIRSCGDGLEAIMDKEKRIIWIGGKGVFEPRTDHAFRRMIQDGRCDEIVEVEKYLEELFDKVSKTFGVAIDRQALLIVHLGDRSVSKLLTILGQIKKVFEQMQKLKVNFKFATSANIEYRSVADPILPWSLTGLRQPKARGSVTATADKSLEEIRKFLYDVDLDQDNKRLKGAVSWIKFEGDLLEILQTQPAQDIEREVKALFAGQEDSHLVRLQLPVIGSLKGIDVTAPGFELYSFSVPPGGSELSASILSKDHCLTRWCANFIPSESRSNVSFVYLSLADLAVENDLSNALASLSQHPIVFITFFDLIDITEADTQETRTLLLNIDKRFLFFDSSIWFRMFPLTANEAKQKIILEDIQRFSSRNTYGIPQAIEAREFDLKLFRSSKILSKDTQVPSHWMISPFLFHSEYKMRELFMNDYVSHKSFFDKIQWCFMLIDDYSQKKLENHEYTKEELVKHVINDMGKISEHTIKLVNRSSLSDGKNSLSMLDKEDWPDAVLLDYLFVESRESIHLGDELIRSISQTTDKSNLKLGPGQRVWIFPVSTYTIAIQNKLHSNGIPLHSNNVVVSHGTDPITSPYLFLHDLITMMKAQFDETIQLVNPWYRQKSLQTPLAKIIVEIGGAKTELRNEAIKQFPKMVEVATNFKFIKERTGENKSIFFTSIYKEYYKGVENYEVEQFRDVIYLLAYGGINDKDRLWGEWSLTKNVLLKKIDPDNMLRESVSNIDHYISTH